MVIFVLHVSEKWVLFVYFGLLGNFGTESTSVFQQFPYRVNWAYEQCHAFIYGVEGEVDLFKDCRDRKSEEEVRAVIMHSFLETFVTF